MVFTVTRVIQTCNYGVPLDSKLMNFLISSNECIIIQNKCGHRKVK